MTLRLNGSSDGSVSLSAPADTSPSGTDVTLTLPTSDGDANQFLQTNGSGVLSWAGAGVTGTVLQVLQTTDTAARSTSSNTFVEGNNNLATNITPASNDSIIIVMVTGVWNSSDGDDYWYATILRDSTNLGHSTRGLAYGANIPGVARHPSQNTMMVVDTSHNSGGSQITYNMHYRNENEDGDGFNLALFNQDHDGNGLHAKMIVIEVAG